MRNTISKSVIAALAALSLTASAFAVPLNRLRAGRDAWRGRHGGGWHGGGWHGGGWMAAVGQARRSSAV